MRWKISFVLWPRRLVFKEEGGQTRFIGWVWMQRAYLVDNLNHGWIAFVHDQNDESLATCPYCHKPIVQRAKSADEGK